MNRDSDVAQIQREVSAIIAQTTETALALVERGRKIESLAVKSNEISAYAEEYAHETRRRFAGRLRRWLVALASVSCATLLLWLVGGFSFSMLAAPASNR